MLLLLYLILSTLDLEGVPEVGGKIGDEEEHYNIPPWLCLLVYVRITAPPKTVYDHGGLKDDLQ